MTRIFISMTLADVSLQTGLVLIFSLTKLTTNWWTLNMLAQNVSL